MSIDKTKRKSLGKGLSALLGDEDAITYGNDKTGGLGKIVDIACVSPGKSQPRQDFDPEQLQALADSIKQNGILQPVLVRSRPEEEGSFEIIAGERRWRAAKIAGLEEIPVIVKELSDAKALGIALIENVQREDLSPIEEAEGYQRLVDELSYTQEQLSEIIGKSRSHIANMLRLNGLPQGVKNLLRAGHLTTGHARTLINNPEAERLAELAVKKGLNVRQMERFVKKAGEEPRIRAPRHALPFMASSGPKSDDVLALESELADLIGLPVAITITADNKGAIAIPFETLDEFDALLQKLSRCKE